MSLESISPSCGMIRIPLAEWTDPHDGQEHLQTNSSGSDGYARSMIGTEPTMGLTLRGAEKNSSAVDGEVCAC